MLVAKPEGKLLEYNWQFAKKYWFKYQTLVGNLLIQIYCLTKARKLDWENDPFNIIINNAFQ